MMVQYAKFIKVCGEIKWRQDVGSLNYIETSTWTRQEHNGFSHQNPSFIGAVLNLKSAIKRVYLPPDANCFLSTIAHCLRSKVSLYMGFSKESELYQFDGWVEAAHPCLVDRSRGGCTLSSGRFCLGVGIDR